MKSSDDTEAAREVKNRLSDERQKRRSGLRLLLENESRKEVMNVEELLKYCRDALPGEPTIALLQDIQRQIHIYSNILEEVKRISMKELKDNKNAAKDIKCKYEQLKLIGLDTLPNPGADELANELIDRIMMYGRALLKIIHDHAPELLRDLHFQAETNFTMQVTMGFPPTWNVGLDRSVA